MDAALHSIGVNPRDPMKPMEERVKVLLVEIGKVCNDVPFDVVTVAAINFLGNVVRQAQPTRDAAERRWDELVGQMKGKVLAHYDAVTGKRRSVFAFDQFVFAERVVSDDIVRR